MSTNATVEPFFVKKCSLEKFNLLDGIPNANWVWLFISPFVMEFREMTRVSSNNMLVGAVVFILGLGVALYEHYYRGEEVCGTEQMARKSA